MRLPRCILKFGGTSVGDATAIRRAGAIVLAARDRDPAVVVSAASGVTDALVALLAEASQGGAESASAVVESIEAVRRRHHAILRDLELPTDLVDEPLAELANLVRGVELLGEATPRTCDRVLSLGERLLAPIFAAHLRSIGLESRAWTGGELGLLTDARFTRARPLPEAYERIAGQLEAAEPHVPVITGHLGATVDGHVTTLGRGGSDYSASLVGRAVRAEEVQIWTDVDGILTADPRLVPAARRIETLSFSEASELAFSGARVLHPSTIAPALEGSIPVRVMNTAAPERAGTTILDTEKLDAERTGDAAPLRSIAHRRGVTVVTLVSPRMLARHGFLSRIAQVFDRHHVSIDMISTSEVSVSLTLDETPPDPRALWAELGEISSVEVEDSRGLVSVVGGGLGRDAGLVAEIFRTVTDTGADVEMISYGTTRTNLSFLVRDEDVDGVVRVLHEKYFEGAKEKSSDG